MARPRGTNQYTFDENYAYIHATQGKVFVVDKCDYEFVKKYRWFAKRGGYHYYAYAHLIGNKKIMLHRYLMCVDNPKILIDHANGDTLDNRRSNLRIASRLENNRNAKKRKNCKSKFKGVTLKPNGKWGSNIKVGDKNLNLGTFDVEIEAAKAYDKAAKEHFGKFARINNLGDKWVTV